MSLVPTALRMVLDADVDDDVFAEHAVGRSRAPRRSIPISPRRSRRGTACPCSRRTAATEFGGGVAGWNLADHEQFAAAKRGSVGRAHPGCALRVVDPDDGRDLGHRRRSGCSRSAPRSSATDGWIRTTDLARIDADGFLWIVGRADQTILRGGFKVQPEVVRGRARARPRRGRGRGGRASTTNASAQVPVAAVERRPGACSTSRRARARCGAHLARYEVPVRVTRRRRAAAHRVGQGRPRRRRATLVATTEARRDADRMSRRVERWVLRRDAAADGRRARRRLRDLMGTVPSLEHPSPELEALVQTVRAAQQRLAAQAPADLRPRVGDDAAPDRASYVDHARRRRLQPVLPGTTSSCARRRRRREGTVEFPIGYEGPPGIVHGGFLAVFFDCGSSSSTAPGLAGKTAELSLRFRRPDAVAHAARATAAERVVDGRRIRSHAELLLGDELLCDAHMVAAKGDRGACPRCRPPA